MIECINAKLGLVFQHFENINTKFKAIEAEQRLQSTELKAINDKLNLHQGINANVFREILDGLDKLKG